MITFNNFQATQNSKILDVTIPQKAIVHFSNEIILYEKPFAGEILYQDIPINICKKSFLKKIYCEIKIGQMFQQNLTLLENLQIYSEICGASLIVNAPIKYFEIQQEFLKEKVKNLDFATICLAEIGLLFYFREKICMIFGMPKNIAENEKVCHLIKTRVNNGNDAIFYAGHKLKIEGQIELEV